MCLDLTVRSTRCRMPLVGKVGRGARDGREFNIAGWLGPAFGGVCVPRLQLVRLFWSPVSDIAATGRPLEGHATGLLGRGTFGPGSTWAASGWCVGCGCDGTQALVRLRCGRMSVLWRMQLCPYDLEATYSELVAELTNCPTQRCHSFKLTGASLSRNPSVNLGAHTLVHPALSQRSSQTHTISHPKSPMTLP